MSKPQIDDPVLIASAPQLAPLGEDQNGGLPDNRSQDTDAGQLTYEPVPPRKRAAISVRYRIRGRGRPLAFPADGNLA